MAILFNHNSSVISLTSPHTTLLLMQDLIDSIRDEEASDRGMQYPKIADAEGKVDIGGGVVGDITVTLLDSWQIEHAVGSYQALLKGGQVVGGLGGNPIAYVPGVQIKMIQSLAGTIVATGSGVTDQDKNDIINGIWESNLTDYTTNGTYGNELATKTDIKASAISSISISDTATIINGTNTSGDFTNTFVRDNIFWIINEASTGLTVECEFSIPKSNKAGTFNVFGHYDGKGSSHYIELWIWNVETLSWELLKELFMTHRTDDSDQIQEYYEQHIDRTTDKVKIRLIHNVTTYTTTHELYLDAILLTSMEITTTEDIAASVWGYSTGLDISRRLGLDPSQPLTVGNGKYSTTDLDIDVTDNLNGTYTLSKN